MKVSLLAILFLVWTTAERADAPRAVAPVTTYEFAEVWQGGKLSHSFSIINEGMSDLILQLTKLEGPGLTAKLQPKIAPGVQSSIAFELDTSRINGPFRAEAIVRSNDPLQPEIRFSLSGAVKKQIEILPYAAVFVSTFVGEKAERKLQLVNHEDRPLKILGVESDSGHFQASFNTVDAGKSFELTVQVPGNTQPGRFAERFFVLTDHPTFSRLPVIVNLLVKGDVYANPDVVEFGEINRPELERPGIAALLTQTFLVKSKSGSVKIQSISTDLPFLSITRSPEGESESIQIDVGVQKDGLPQGPINGHILIQTNDDAVPQITVPVTGYVR